MNQKEFSKLSMIVLVGDVYDRLLNTSSSDYILSIEWLTELVIFCKNNNIKLRILEGTPSHDWKQCKVLYTIIDRLNLDVDFKYIETLHIEIMSDLNLSVLYVPDEWKHKASETYDEILELMVANNLSKVDVAFMHGQFHYQLPMIRLESSFSEEDMLNIVNYYIAIGHIHTPSVFERILAQGSFDRLAHNEEEDKGGIYIDVKSEKDMRFIFLKNNNARIFKTITINRDKSELAKIYKDIDKVAKDLPETAFLRILCKHKLEISKEVKDKYNLSGVKEEIPSKERANIRDLFSIKNNNIVELQITKDNVIDLIKEELKDIDPIYVSIIEKKILKLNETI